MIREDLKKLLLSFKEEDFYNNVDLHIHTSESDGKLSPYEVIEQAKARNLKYISIADHNNIDAYLSTNILKEEIIIPAVEFDCIYKANLIHILGYGIDVDNERLKQFYSNSKSGRKFNIIRLLNLRNPKEVILAIKEAGGIAVLAHPACLWTINLDTFIKDLIDMGLDGVEVYYPYKGLRGILKFHHKKKVEQIADKYNLIKTGGTDSHGKKLIKN